MNLLAIVQKLNRRYNLSNDKILFDYIFSLDKQRDKMLDKIDNTGHNDILRLRNEAAERGVELTPDEITDLIVFMKEALK